MEGGHKPLFTNLDSALVYHYVYLWGTGSELSWTYSQTQLNFSEQNIYENDLVYNNIFREEGMKMKTALQFFYWETFDETLFDFGKIDQAATEMNLKVGKEGEIVYLQQEGSPTGKKAKIISGQSNITALDGVIHKVDDILFAHP